MIHSDYFQPALHSLHRVLIEARLMGYQGHDGGEIAEILDWAELLPVYLASPEDKTEDFRNVLKALADQDPRFAHALATFDQQQEMSLGRRR